MNIIKNIFVFILIAFVYFQCSQTSEKSMPDENAEQVEVLDSATLQAMDNFEKFCSSCHGEQMMAFADRKWKHGKERDSIYASIKNGYADAGMPSWEASFSEQEINNLVDYILKGIENVERYGFQEVTLESDTFETELVKFSLDTIVSGMTNPWGMTFLPSGDILVTERSGELYKVDANGTKEMISGTPKVMYKGQGGLLDIELHPDFESNKWLYLSYSDFKVEDGDTLSGTAVSRYKFEGNKLTDGKKIFEGHPYSTKRQHYGSRLQFDQEGYLSIKD